MEKRPFFIRKEGIAFLVMFFGAIFSIEAWLLLRETPVLAYEKILTPKEYLFEQCIGDCDALALDAIATCESQWRMVKNATSSAYGYFQILDSTERTTPQYKEGQRKFDPYANVDMAIWLYEQYGTNPWNESKGCWYWRMRMGK